MAGRGVVYRFRWVVGLPVVLLVLASVNFMVISDDRPPPYVLVLPVIVGIVLGMLIQVIERQKQKLALINLEMRDKQRELEQQHEERRRIIDRMRRFQGAAITALGAVHDIRNSTTPIVHAADMIEPATPDDAKTLQDLSDAGQRISALTNRLLQTLHGKDVLGVEKKSAPELLDDAWHAIASLVPEVSPRMAIAQGHLRVDADDLKQILHNLVLNAQRATGTSLQLKIEGKREGDRYCIDVRDNGPGLPEDVLAHLGQLHVSQEDGQVHGLGLAIVSHLATRNEGRLTALTGPDGTEFKLYFPAA